MIRVLNISLSLNEGQKQTLDRLYGCYRFVYNHLLDLKIREYQNNKISLSSKDLSKYFHSTLLRNPNYAFLKEFNSNILKVAILNIETSFKNMIKHKKGFPRFKSKRNNKEVIRFITPTCISKNNLVNNKINLTKNLKNMKFRTSELYTNYLLGHKDDIKSIYITKTCSGKYRASVCIDSLDSVNKKPVKETSDVIGVDLGVKNFIHTSKDEITPNINKNVKVVKYRKKIKSLQKSLSKKVKGSKNRNKIRVKLSEYHEKIKNITDNHLHQVTFNLINENQVIKVENLNVSGLLRNHKLAKHIQESSFYEFKRQLEYKCQKYNRELVIIDRFYPSSKMCSECGTIKKDLKLSDRVYICPDCGLELDRDLNASINIKNYVGSWRPKLRLVEDVVVDDPIGNNMLKSETPVKQELPRITNRILE